MGQPMGDDDYSGTRDKMPSYPADFHDNSFDNVPLPPEPPVEDAPPEEYSFSQSSGNESSSSDSGTRSWEQDRGHGAHASAIAGATLEYTPPYNIEAEQSVPGTISLNSGVIADVYEQLTPEDFYRPAHQTICSAVLHLYGESSRIGPTSLVDRLDRTGGLKRIGGPLYLRILASLVPTVTNAQFHARAVTERATIRRLIKVGTKIAQIGYTDAEDTESEQLVDETQQLTFSVGHENTKNDYIPIADVLDNTLEELDLIIQNSGLARDVPTGIINLGKLTSGLHSGQVVIIAARPGVGKSTSATDLTCLVSIHNGMTSAISSSGISRNEIMIRIMSVEAKINMASLRPGDLDEWDWTKLVEIGDRICDAPLFIDDSSNLTMMEIHTKARQLRQKHDLKIVVVDYLQLIGSGKKVESRQQEVSEFSRRLKLLAKGLEVPLIATSQLNHDPGAHTGKKPQVSDLRESDLLEQDADTVTLIYWPDPQEAGHGHTGEVGTVVAKHRGGPARGIAVAYRLYYSRFANLAEEPNDSS